MALYSAEKRRGWMVHSIVAKTITRGEEVEDGFVMVGCSRTRCRRGEREREARDVAESRRIREAVLSQYGRAGRRAGTGFAAEKKESSRRCSEADRPAMAEERMGFVERNASRTAGTRRLRSSIEWWWVSVSVLRNA